MWSFIKKLFGFGKKEEPAHFGSLDDRATRASQDRADALNRALDIRAGRPIPPPQVSSHPRASPVMSPSPQMQRRDGFSNAAAGTLAAQRRTNDEVAERRRRDSEEDERRRRQQVDSDLAMQSAAVATYTPSTYSPAYSNHGGSQYHRTHPGQHPDVNGYQPAHPRMEPEPAAQPAYHCPTPTYHAPSHHEPTHYSPPCSPDPSPDPGSSNWD